jgi:hypothetical protein
MSAKQRWMVLCVGCVVCGLFGVGGAARAEEPGAAPVEQTAPSVAGPREGCPREAAISPSEVKLSAAGVFSAEYSHGGGCGAHDYCVGYDDSQAPARVEVWMSHIHDGTDMCEMLIMKKVQAQLPASALTAKERLVVVGADTPRPLAVESSTVIESTDCPKEAMVFGQNVTLSAEGTLSATYMHSGGCGEHTYCVGYRHEAATDAAQVWIGHIHDGTDRCKAMVDGVASRALPTEVVKAKTLTILTPGAETALPR